MSGLRKQMSNFSRQIAVQRRNLVAVCRLAVKSLLERSCFEPIDDGSEELYNFCTIMEHILSHRLKPHQTWYGTEETRPFWDYIRTVCSDIPHNCLESIQLVEKPKTPRGKGRAWLRMVLMEKRLAEYFCTALQHSRVTRSFYADGAVMLGEEVSILSGILLGLNTIDFSFDIKGEDLDQAGAPVINFTPYLKFEQCRGILDDPHELRDLTNLMSMSLDSDVFIDENSDTWRARYYKVDAKFKVISEQKGYLEELVRLRESQLEEEHRQRHKLIATLQHYEAESRRERQQLEAVIIELQAQLGTMKEEHHLKLQQMQILLHKYTMHPPSFDPPDIALRDMTSLTAAVAIVPSIQSLASNELTVVTSAVTLPTSRPVAADAKSIISGTSSVSVAREDSQSMVPLTGSLTSHASYLSTDLQMHAVAAALQSAEPGAANENRDVAGGGGDHVTGENQSEREMRFPMKVLGSVSDHSTPVIDQVLINPQSPPHSGNQQKVNREIQQEQLPISQPPPQPSAQLSAGEPVQPELVEEETESLRSSEKDIPKPDLVTSCHSSLDMEKENAKEEKEILEKEVSVEESEGSVTEEDLTTQPENQDSPVAHPTED